MIRALGYATSERIQRYLFRHPFSRLGCRHFRQWRKPGVIRHIRSRLFFDSATRPEMRQEIAVGAVSGLRFPCRPRRRRLTLSHCAGQRSGAQRLSALPKGFWDRCRMFWAIPKLELPPLMPPLLLEGWGAWCFGIRGCVTKCNQVGWSLLSIRWTIAI